MDIQEINKQQIIILCGPDQCGKTEISKELSYSLQVPQFKAGTEHNTYLNNSDQFIHQLRYADTRMVDFLKQTGHSVIFDRAYPCEAVYSKVMERKTDSQMLVQVDKKFSELNTKIIVCYRENYEGIQDDIDPQIVSSTLERIELEYRRWAETSKCDILFLPVDDEDLTREVLDIVNWLNLTNKKPDIVWQLCGKCKILGCSNLSCWCECHNKEIKDYHG